MFDGDKLIDKVPLRWKKNFSCGMVIPHKTRKCNKCTKYVLCDGSETFVNQKTRIFCKP